MWANEDGQDFATKAEITVEVGFNVGFATCWLLMTAINGHGGVQ